MLQTQATWKGEGPHLQDRHLQEEGVGLDQVPLEGMMRLPLHQSFPRARLQTWPCATLWGTPPQSVPSWPLWSLLSSQAPGEEPCRLPESSSLPPHPHPVRVCMCRASQQLPAFASPFSCQPSPDPHSSGLEGSREPPAP